MDVNLCILFVIFNLGCVISDISLRFVFIIEGHEKDLTQKIGKALKFTEQAYPNLKLKDSIIFLDRESEEEAYNMLCSAISKDVSMMIDLSWSSWHQAEEMSLQTGVPLIRTELGSQQLVKAIDDYLESRNATDAAIIVENEADVDKTLYKLLGNSNIRIWVNPGLSRDSAKMLKTMRPEPSFHVLVGESGFVMDTYKRAVKEKLVRRSYRWNLVITDYSTIDTIQLILPTVILQADSSECCRMIGLKECTCPENFQRIQELVNSLLQYVTEVYLKLSTDFTLTAKVDCDNLQSSDKMNETKEVIFKQFAEDTESSNETVFFWDEERTTLFPRSRFILSIYKPDRGLEKVASWHADEEYSLLPGVTLEPLRMFFRVGTSPAVPWTMPKLDPNTGELMFTEDGQPMYGGYCIDLIDKIAEALEFDYEIISPKSGGFGQKLPNGSWDGVVGDLIKGKSIHVLLFGIYILIYTAIEVRK